MEPSTGRLDRIEEAIRELVESQKKTDEQQKKTDEQIMKTNEQIRDTSRRVTELTDGWGMFVEGLVAPSIPKIFAGLGFEILRHGVRQKARFGGRSVEIDVIAAGTRDGVQRVTIAASVKSRLQVSDVRDHLARLGEFFDFYPEYRASKLIGVVAGIRLDEGVIRFAEKEGLYVIGSSGEVVELMNTPGFRPRLWGE